jgi:large subunit ribosomal protein L9
MKVILLKDVKGIGQKFQEKEVSSGHAINFLIPQKLAVPANSPAASQANAKRQQEEQSRQKKNETMSEEVAKLANTEVKISLKANEKGHLFASLNGEKISQALKEQKGITIEASHISLQSPIKEVGTHKIPVKVGDKVAYFDLVVESK